jgi:hypothetical protein
MRGCRVYHFDWRELEQLVTYKNIRELLGFQKGTPEKVDVPKGILDEFWDFNLRGSPPTKEFHPEPHHPSISLMDV